MNYKKEDLLSICEDSIVPCSNWDNRDSHNAQKQLSDIYGLLSIGAEYITSVSNDTISIDFINLSDDLILQINRSLDVDTIDDYYNLESTDSDDEMFDGGGILEECFKLKEGAVLSGYLPTRERLQEVDGDDWY